MFGDTTSPPKLSHPSVMCKLKYTKDCIKHLVIDVSCAFCIHDAATLNHLFFACDTSCEIWIQKRLDWSSPDHVNNPQCTQMAQEVGSGHILADESYENGVCRYSLSYLERPEHEDF